MNITEAKIKLVSDKEDKLKAFCSITIDREFVIRDIKIIEGASGCFVAMPSRKLTDRCPACGGKNHLRAAHCNQCGGPLSPNRVGHDEAGRVKLHVDIAHPINSACREKIQQQILAAYEKELKRPRQPDRVGPAEGPSSARASPGGQPDAERQAQPPSVGTEPPPAEPPEPLPEQDSFSGGIF